MVLNSGPCVHPALNVYINTLNKWGILWNVKLYTELHFNEKKNFLKLRILAYKIREFGMIVHETATHQMTVEFKLSLVVFYPFLF